MKNLILSLIFILSFMGCSDNFINNPIGVDKSLAENQIELKFDATPFVADTLDKIYVKLSYTISDDTTVAEITYPAASYILSWRFDKNLADINVAHGGQSYLNFRIYAVYNVTSLGIKWTYTIGTVYWYPDLDI